MKIILIFLISFSLWAGNGNEVGNGGDVLVCPEKPILLFDYYEAAELKRYVLHFAKGKDWYEVAANTLKRLKDLNQDLYTQYMTNLSQFNSKMLFIKDSNFRDIKDSFEVSIPKACQLKQIAIQQKDLEVTRIHVSKDLWFKLAKEQKAGLVLHEIIYEHFILLGQKNSVKVRRFNALLASKEILKMKKKDFETEVRKYRLPLY